LLTIDTTPDLRVSLDGARIAGLSNSKGGAVALYLALNGGAAPRSTVAGLLWSELGEDEALNNLRFTLSRLRRQAPGVIEATRREVRLSDAVPRRVDVDAIDGPDAATLLALRIESFLANLRLSNAEAFGEWASQVRDELARRYLQRMAELAEQLRAAGEFERAAEACRRCLALEPWSERFHRALAEIHIASNDEAGALAQLAACRETLRRELAVEPEPETRRLEEALRARRRATVAANATARGGRAPAALGVVDVGMEAERARLTELALSPGARIVTVLGPGGAGKTHLARAVMGAIADRFADGTAAVALADVDPRDAGGGAALLLARIAAALGVDLVPGRELGSLVEAARGQRRLVLVDNFESVGGAWPTLGALSEGAPGLKFLVTSRHHLGLATEWVVRLRGLAWPAPDPPGPDRSPPGPPAWLWREEHRGSPAVALFLASAERVGLPLDPSREGEAILRICAALEGWPLGLILAASWLQVYGCAEIARTLEASAVLLSDPAPALIDDRHRSAARVLDQSWALLDDEERAAFAALCVFRGRFDAASAATVAGAAPAVLGALVGKSLLRRDAQGALSIHPLLRDFGLRRLDETPTSRDAVHAAHAARSAAALSAARVAFVAGGDPAAFDGAAALVGDHFAALRWLADGGAGAAIDDFVEDLWLLHRARGWIEDGVGLLEGALGLPDLTPERGARWGLFLSDALFQLGRLDASAQAALAVLALLGERGEAGAGSVAILDGMARVLLRAPRRGPARDGTTLAARAWNRIAQVRFFEGDRDGFVAATLRSVTYRGVGKLPATFASTALVLSYTPFRSSAARAARQAERTLDAADPFDRAWAQEQVALYRLGVGELDKARRHALDGAAIFRRLAQRRNWAECQALAAHALFFADRVGAAREEMLALRGESARLREGLGEVWGSVGVLTADLMAGGPVAAFDVPRARALAAEASDPSTWLQLLVHPEQRDQAAATVAVRGVVRRRRGR
jgi:DNA-binding SARP family transcriptional activator